MVIRDRCISCIEKSLSCTRRNNCSNCKNNGYLCKYTDNPVNLPMRAAGPNPIATTSDEDHLNHPPPVSQTAPQHIHHPAIPEIDPADYLMPDRINGMPIHNGKPLRSKRKSDAISGLEAEPSKRKRRIATDKPTSMSKNISVSLNSSDALALEKDRTVWTKVDMTKENKPVDRKGSQKAPYIWAAVCISFPYPRMALKQPTEL